MFMQCLCRSVEGIIFPGTGLMDDCEPPRGYCRSNPGPLWKSSNSISKALVVQRMTPKAVDMLAKYSTTK